MEATNLSTFDEVLMKCADKGGKILLVEDEQQIRSMLHDLLVNQGYNVIQAVDGVDALDKFKKDMHEIVLVISDIIMPRMDGISSCKIMSAINPSIKFLYISGCTSEQRLPDEAKVLAKPFSPLEFLGAVKSILAARTPF